MSWQRYCTASSSGRQPNFAALNRGRHLCSTGRPSGWALAHILVSDSFTVTFTFWLYNASPVRSVTKLTDDWLIDCLRQWPKLWERAISTHVIYETDKPMLMKLETISRELHARSAEFYFDTITWVVRPNTQVSLLWSPYEIGQTIIFSSCRLFFLLLSVFLLSFPRLISAVAEWMSAILADMVWPSCEFKKQVWNVLNTARWKYRTQKKSPKSPSGHHRTTLLGYIFATKPHIDNRKKLVKQQYVRQMFS